MKMFVVFTILLKVSTQNKPQQSYIGITQFNDCEGKSAGNYTRVRTFASDLDCSNAMATSTHLIQCSSTGQLSVNTFQELATQRNPAGAYTQTDVLSLIASGPLQGSFVYSRYLRPQFTYLKKCSSILGQSAISPLNPVLMIADKLDLNVLIAPLNGYERFKRSAHTICKGMSHIF